jgi:hypothetical protein
LPAAANSSSTSLHAWVGFALKVDSHPFVNSNTSAFTLFQGATRSAFSSVKCEAKLLLFRLLAIINCAIRAMASAILLSAEVGVDVVGCCVVIVFSVRTPVLSYVSVGLGDAVGEVGGEGSGAVLAFAIVVGGWDVASGPGTDADIRTKVLFFLLGLFGVALFVLLFKLLLARLDAALSVLLLFSLVSFALGFLFALLRNLDRDVGILGLMCHPEFLYCFNLYLYYVPFVLI